MNDDVRDAGFLSRWSRRKVQVREGGVPVEPPPVAVTPPAPDVQVAAVPPPAVPPFADVQTPLPEHPAPAEAVPPPTLADVAGLTRESDYTRFVARSVDPEVRNAALKKLFTDPHYNVMDGLDTYIDDYGKPDPLPEGMLRKMVQSKLLGLFSDEDDKDADEPGTTLAAAPPSPEAPTDEDADLRLQPHDDPGRPGPAPGTGQDGGGEH